MRPHAVGLAVWLYLRIANTPFGFLVRPLHGWVGRRVWAQLAEDEEFMTHIRETERNYELGRWYEKKVGKNTIHMTPDMYEQLGRPEDFVRNPDWKDL